MIGVPQNDVAKHTLFGVCTAYNYSCFSELYEYFYLVWKQSSIEIIILYYVVLSNVIACANIIDIFILF